MQKISYWLNSLNDKKQPKPPYINFLAIQPLFTTFSLLLTKSLSYQYYMKPQQQNILLDNRKISNPLTTIFKSGFSDSAGLVAKDKYLIYANGKNMILDYYQKNSQAQFLGHDAFISSFAVSNNLLIASGQLASPGSKSFQSQVLLWRIGDDYPVAKFSGLRQGVKSVMFSNDCRFLAAVSFRDQLIVWDIKTKSQILVKNFDNPLLILNFVGETIVLIVGKNICNLSLLSLLTQNKPPSITNYILPSTGMPRNYTSLVELGKETYAIGTQSGEICIFAKGIFRSSVVGGKGKVNSLGLINGKQLFASIGKQIVRFDVIGEQLKQRDRQTIQNVRKISINEKGEIFLLTKNQILRLNSNLQLQSVRHSHSSKINSITHKNNLIASIDEEGIAFLHHFQNGSIRLLNIWNGRQNPGRAIQFGSSNNILVGFSDGVLISLNAQLKGVQWQISAHKGSINTIYSGQSYILTGGEDCIVRIWSKTRQLINQISAHQKGVAKVLGDLNLTHVVHSASFDRTIQSYDMKIDKKMNFKQSKGSSVTDMAQQVKSGDLITCGYGSYISFWRLNEPQPYKNFIVEGTEYVRLSLSPSGAMIALGQNNGIITLVSMKNNSHLISFIAHTSGVTGLAWINQNTLISSSEDFSITAWSFS